MNRFIAIDLETTGLDHSKDEIIEIALVLFVEGKPTQKLTYVLHAEQPLRPFISQLTGITQEEITRAPRFAEVIKEVSALIKDQWLVAYNSDFDRQFLEKAFQKEEKTVPTNQWLDALLAARTAWPRLENHKLDTVTSFLKLERETAHRALPDALAAGEVFLHALRTIRSRPTSSLEALALLSKGTAWEQFYPQKNVPYKECWAPFPKPEQKQQPDAIIELKLDEEEERLSSFIQEGWKQKKISIVERKTETAENALMHAIASSSLDSPMRWVVVAPRERLTPFCTSCQEAGISATIFRRFNQYPCRRRLELFTQVAERALTVDERHQMMPLLSWWHTAKEGELIEDNGGFSIRRHFQLWNKISSHSAACSHEDCASGECSVHLARLQAEKAQLILVDHDFFFHDLQNDFALLPHWDHLIITEADEVPKRSIEETEKFIRFYHLRNIIQRFENPWNNSVGLLLAAQERQPKAKEFRELQPALQLAEKELQRLFMRIGNHAAKLKTRGPFAYRESLVGMVRLEPLTLAIESLIQLSKECEKKSRELSSTDLWFKRLAPEFLIFQQELKLFYNDLATLLEARDLHRIYWIEEWHNPHHLQIHGALRSAGNLIGKPLSKLAASLTWIGAPLAARVRLNRFLNAVGLLPSNRLVSYDTPSIHSPATLLTSHTASNKATIPDFSKQVDLVKSIHSHINGRIVLLLPTIRQLEEWRQSLSEGVDRPLFAEGIDAALSNLLDHDPSQKALLLATDWNLATALTANDLLIIPRIPFAQGRSIYLEQLAQDLEFHQKNSSQELIIPEAALQLRRWLDAHPATPRLILDHRTIFSRYAQDLNPIWGEECKTASSDQEVIDWVCAHCSDTPEEVL